MWIGVIHVLVYVIITILLAMPLGWYIAKVLENKATILDGLFKPCERLLARCCGINLEEDMDWKQYLVAMLMANLWGFLIVYFIQRLQAYLPLNPQQFPGVAPDLAFNTAASFVTNSNWQAYGGETTMSYLSQMLALTSQQFISVGTGLGLMAAFIRGLIRREATGLGNFWQDLIRSILYILIPLALLWSLLLVSQGVIQNFKPYVQATLIEPINYEENNIAKTATTQIIPMGPVAAMIAIKELGTNGGGFFNVNSAHPFENPNLITNYLELIAITLIPIALCFTFGCMIKDMRQTWALLATMIFIFVPMTIISINAEVVGNPALKNLTVDSITNMEGKELRFGPIYSGLWGSATTATSNGSVNSMHDSAMPMSGLIYLFLMQMGEIIFGGVGCGMYGMLLVVIIAVFVAGLMVGRTPEYLGKKIEPYEMKMVSLVAVVMSMTVLLASAFACVTDIGTSSLGNPGAHGLSEILYAFTSMRNNNGSAFAGLNANTMFYNVLGGVIMLIGRFWLIVGLLAVSGSLVRKKIVPITAGTLETHTTTFVGFLIGVILIICTLSFLPVLALGPLVEHFVLWGVQ